MKSISSIWRRARRSVADLVRDRSGIAATEFAVIVPIMLVMFFGTVEFSSGIAVYRKITLMARTLSDLTSQSTSVADSDMTNFFAASTAIMTPYAPPLYTTPSATISELYIDPTTGVARVQWSKGSSPRAASSPVTVPAGVIARNPVTNAILPNQYVIFSETSVLYKPTIGYVMAKAGLTFKDVAYTRPRQSICVFYSPATTCTTL